MRNYFVHISIATLLIIPFLATAQYTDIINSNRPSQSMGAFSVGTNVYQWEQGLSMRSGSFSSFYNARFLGIGSRAQLRVGLFKEQLEFVGTLDYQMDQLSYTNALGSFSIVRNGFKQAAFGAKYLIYDPFRNVDKYKVNLYSWHANNKFRWRDLIPAVSVYAAAQFNLGDVYPYQYPFHSLFRFNYKPIVEPAISANAMVLLQQHIRPGWVLIHNAGMQYIATDFSSIKVIGTLTYSHRDKWSFYGEYQLDDGVLYRDLSVGAGAAYLFNRNFQLDVAAQVNLKDTPQLLTVGLGIAYRIDRHNIYADAPQSIAEQKEAKKERKKTQSESKSAKKTERRINKGLRKLDKKQKRLERKIKRKK